jgi:tryptophan 2,3-dioxygenase
VSEFISYATGRCCCGKFNDLDKGEDFICNDIVHQLLGPEDNFCGHKNTHLIINLESRVRELESELKHCKESEGWSKMMAMEGRIESLEAELLEKRQSIVLTATEADKNIDELEAERDFQHGRADAYHKESVKYRDQVKNLSHLLEKMAGRNQDLEQLRARHAALVEVGNKLIGCIERNYGNATGLHINIYEYKEELKAALAEVN